MDPTGLTPGDYCGRIEVRSTGASNSPQYITVVLNILPPNTPLGPVVRPTGLIFTGIAGGDSPGSQDALVSDPTASPVTFGSSRTFVGGGNWFLHQPSDATVKPNQPARVVVQPDFSSTQSGIWRGVLTLGFTDGSIATVAVLGVLAPAGTIPAAAGEFAESIASPRAAGCTPSSLVLQPTSLGNQFTVSLLQPASLQVRIVDSCGSPLTSGMVVATFSNSDPQINLVHIGNGTWSGTWQPKNAAQNQVQIGLTAIQGQTRLGGQAILSGTVHPGAPTPLVYSGSVLNAASFAARAPVAPGSLISIFGQQLADGQAIADQAPIPTDLNGTEVLLGGRPLPLRYASDGQLNAQVPYDLAVDTQLSLLVRRGTALSVPENITVAAAQPAVFTVDQSGQGQGAIFRQRSGALALADSAAPAQAGDALIIYCTGLGTVDPPVVEGTAAPLSPLSSTKSPVTVMEIGRAHV